MKLLRHRHKVIATLLVLSLFFCFTFSTTASAASTTALHSNINVNLTMPKGYSMLVIDEFNNESFVMRGFAEGKEGEVPGEYSFGATYPSKLHFIPVKNTRLRPEGGNEIDYYTRVLYKSATAYDWVNDIVKNKREIIIPEGTNTFYITPESFSVSLDLTVTVEDPVDTNTIWDEMVRNAQEGNANPKPIYAKSIITPVAPNPAYEVIYLNYGETIERVVKSPRGQPGGSMNVVGYAGIYYAKTDGDLYTFTMTSYVKKPQTVIYSIKGPWETPIKIWEVRLNTPKE